jgi:hypothetical protein
VCAVVVDDDAAVGQPGDRAVRAGEDRRLGADLGLEGRRGEGATIAAIVASESASCAARRSTPRRATIRPPIISPRLTPAVASRSARIPAARLVIQNRCSPVMRRTYGWSVGAG